MWERSKVYLEDAYGALRRLVADPAIPDAEKLECLMKLSTQAGELINRTVDDMRRLMSEPEVAKAIRGTVPPRRRNGG